MLTETSIAAFIEPVLKECHGSAAADKHLMVVAHGIFNAEFIGAFLARRNDPRPVEWAYKGESTQLQYRYTVSSG
jgi:hypothetical protein